MVGLLETWRSMSTTASITPFGVTPFSVITRRLWHLDAGAMQCPATTGKSGHFCRNADIAGTSRITGGTPVIVQEPRDEPNKVTQAHL
jgi:hypothetical protein